MTDGGWTLPTTKQINGITGGASGSTTYVSKFAPIRGGGYSNGILYYESTHGSWWGNGAYNNAGRYYLTYDSNNLFTDSYGGTNGLYIRCVSEEKTVTDLTYMLVMIIRFCGKIYRETFIDCNQEGVSPPKAGRCQINLK